MNSNAFFQFTACCLLLLDAGSLCHFGKESNQIKFNNGNNGPFCVAANHNGYKYLTSFFFFLTYVSPPPYEFTTSVYVHCTVHTASTSLGICVLKHQMLCYLLIIEANKILLGYLSQVIKMNTIGSRSKYLFRYKYRGYSPAFECRSVSTYCISVSHDCHSSHIRLSPNHWEKCGIAFTNLDISSPHRCNATPSKIPIHVQK